MVSHLSEEVLFGLFLKCIRSRASSELVDTGLGRLYVALRDLVEFWVLAESVGHIAYRT